MIKHTTPLELQPIPYQGSKRRLAPQICTFFPQSVDTLYEPFAGSAAITIYAASHNLAEKFVIGDVFPSLIALWRLIIEQPRQIAASYRSLWFDQFKCSGHFANVRAEFNQNQDPCCLLYLIARSTLNHIRFNSKGDFNAAPDNRRVGLNPDTFDDIVRDVSFLLKGKTKLFCGDFQACTKDATKQDLVYMDPPYQGAMDQKAKPYYAHIEREPLIDAIRSLNSRRVPFVLSYDGTTGNKNFAEAFPSDLNLTLLHLQTGKSSRSTLAGRQENTTESLYISDNLVVARKL